MDFIMLFILGVMVIVGKMVKDKVGTEESQASKASIPNQPAKRASTWMATLEKAMSQATEGKPSASDPYAGQAAVSRPAARMETSRKPEIVQRAVKNNARFQEDDTLKAIEEAHGHKEVHKEPVVEHSRNCQTLQNGENVEEVSENLLGNTEDLMVMGYSGNLQFERDFLGEAMDLLGAISTPNTDLPKELTMEHPME